MAANVVSQARGKKKTRTAAKGALWENVKSLGGAVLIYLVIKTFLFEAYRIPSGSMIPTLLVGDWLFVNKAVYGAAVPFTDVHMPAFAEPQRGEVIVFKSPTQIDQPEDPNPTLVKRLVGMPGDTLFMRGGMLFVNGVAQRQGFGAQSRPGIGTSQPSETHPLFEWQHAIELKQSRFGAPPTGATHATTRRTADTGVSFRARTSAGGLRSSTTRTEPTIATARSPSSPTSGGDASGRVSTSTS